jgi:DNA-directed RNA polymerase subunit L
LFHQNISSSNGSDFEMKEWLFYQVEHFNALMLFVMIIFVTAMSKANTQKLLKEQSQEIYNEVEEIKSEIWRAASANKKE